MSELDYLLLVWAAITVPGALLGWWGVFRKAGRPGWTAVVPIYNVYVLVIHVAQLSLLWFLLCLVPLVQIIAVILVNIEVAKRFGRSEAYGLGLTVIGFVFYPILGLGPARYRK